ncbi:hypothetical protein [Haliscomenobacter sp.]|uniref:hypothetical protein n=1 Tax=Haliscomenobacter sp. TaxID=2717303 RepID=UPI003BAC6168
MQKKIITIFLLGLLPGLLCAQKKALIYTQRDTIQFEVVEQSGKLALQFNPEQTKHVDFTTSYFMAITGLRLEDADLQLAYELGSTEKGFNYITSVLLLNQTGRVITPLPFKAKGALGSLTEGTVGLRSMTWLDALEDVLIFGQKYQLVLSAELWGNVDCADVRPAFTLGQQLPHLGIAAGGLILTGIGQFQKSKKIDAYNTYKSYYSNNQPYKLAQPFFDQAKDYEKEARLYTYAGWAVLSLDAAVYLYRALNTMARQKQYDKYCGNQSFSLRLDTRPLGDGSNAMKVQLAFNLK